jgi:hypothetical protein
MRMQTVQAIAANVDNAGQTIAVRSKVAAVLGQKWQKVGVQLRVHASAGVNASTPHNSMHKASIPQTSN